jgi:hypothetical protein
MVGGESMSVSMSSWPVRGGGVGVRACVRAGVRACVRARDTCLVVAKGTLPPLHSANSMTLHSNITQLSAQFPALPWSFETFTGTREYAPVQVPRVVFQPHVTRNFLFSERVVIVAPHEALVPQTLPARVTCAAAKFTREIL